MSAKVSPAAAPPEAAGTGLEEEPAAGAGAPAGDVPDTGAAKEEEGVTSKAFLDKIGKSAAATGFSDNFLGAYADAKSAPPVKMEKPLLLDVGVAAAEGHRRLESNTDLHSYHVLHDGKVQLVVLASGDDGHEAAEWAIEHLHEYLVAAVHFPADLQLALQEAFFELEDLFYRWARRRPRNLSYASVTAIVFNGHKTYTGGVGINRCFVMGQDMWMDALSGLHLPTEPKEKRRILKKGGNVERAGFSRGFCGFKCRCLSFFTPWVVTPGDIPLSRAIGAVSAKFDRIGAVPDTVIGEPEMWYHGFDWENNYAVIIGSGPFWAHFKKPYHAFGIVVRASIDHIKAAGKREMHQRTMEFRQKRKERLGLKKDTYIADPSPVVGMTRAQYCAHVLMEYVNRKRRPWCPKIGRPRRWKAAKVVVIIPPDVDRGVTSFPSLKKFRAPPPAYKWITMCGMKLYRTEQLAEPPADGVLSVLRETGGGNRETARKMPLSADLTKILMERKAERDRKEAKKRRKELKSKRRNLADDSSSSSSDSEPDPDRWA